MRTPLKITISFETGNAAFDDCPHGEIARILRNIARGFSDQSLLSFHGVAAETKTPVRDPNGNTIGQLSIKGIK